ncbi:hypothetical protein A0J61_08522 [Choanephora cucurbitarum]|uniref:Uncharacterized protein n=1 Tax=Choanephora cucurbitarum TaxID=101091 RepID=A0A1C7N2V5_9FUNG|nr:hypothetical protein A0J61_08522 [Choanephora cucurbitarum]
MTAVRQSCHKLLNRSIQEAAPITIATQHDRATRNSSSGSSQHGPTEEKPQRRSFFGFGSNNGSTTTNNKDQDDLGIHNNSSSNHSSHSKEKNRLSAARQSLGNTNTCAFSFCRLIYPLS